MSATQAEESYHRLDTAQKAILADLVFAALEYDEDGNPGSEWSSDTLQTIGEVFESAGVHFTDPNDPGLAGVL